MSGLKNIIVIGASAGGLQALTNLVAKLPTHIDAAFFVVLHLSKQSSGEIISYHLQKQTSIICKVATDGEDIQKGHLYIAPPDYHMLLKNNQILLNNGPQENRWRPSIDVLFRSAAVAFDSNVTGIILSGLLDDGTSGMSAIKRCGGICIVQEPDEAEFPDMPYSVLNNVNVDHRVPITDMGYILEDIFSKPETNDHLPIPEDVKLENEMTENMLSSIETIHKIASQSHLSCPDCGGNLWKINNDVVSRYRCHTGHVYTENVFLNIQSTQIRESVWVSIRMLEQRKNLFLTMAQHDRGNKSLVAEAEKRKGAEDLNIHIERLKVLLKSLKL